jgi:hypothetical protein
MPSLDIALQRLHNQGLLGPKAATLTEVVTWQGAVQSQDYAGAKWALGQRLPEATDAMLDKAFAEGAILRTHILRPTWHFVAPADIRWMLALTAPRVHALNAYYYRQLELDDALLAQSTALLAKVLKGGAQLTRTEIQSHLRNAGIVADGLRLAYLIMHAELQALICSGARRGKQFTYALLDERAPAIRSLSHDEALAELVLRYFQSHGPATVNDFVWWSGLTVTDGRTGLEALSGKLVSETMDGKEYWQMPTSPAQPPTSPIAHLLPNYDECLASYRDRSASVSGSEAEQIYSDRASFPHLVVINGRLAGMWKRTQTAKRVSVEFQLFRTLSDMEHQALGHAVERYGQFLEIPASVDRVEYVG